MKKEKYLKISLLWLIIIYIFSLIMFKILNISEHWFCLGLLFVAVFLFIKAYMFRSDSSLYLASLCLFFAVNGSLTIVYNLSAITTISLSVLCFSLAHLILFSFFHKLNNFYIFIFLFVLFLPIFLFAFYCINLRLMILLLCGEMLAGLLLHLGVKYGRF